jgi:hypothetical protein
MFNGSIKRLCGEIQPFRALKQAQPIASSFRKSQDVVSQCVQLSRVSSDPDLWRKALQAVIPSVPILKGEDIASILKASARSGVRDETLLAAVCESLKTLPLLRVVRIRDVSSIFTSFFRLNFAPSVETLNSLSAEVVRSLDLYRTRNQDICLLYRYYSVLARNPSIVINYDSNFEYPFLLEKLERAIENRLGRFGSVELCVIAKYTNRISLERLVVNFTRAQHVKPALKQAFIRQLDERFGNDSWKQFEHMFVPDMDSTGWSRPIETSDPTDDIFAQHNLMIKEKKERLPLFQLHDELVAQALASVPSPRRPKKGNESRKDGPKSPNDSESPLSDDQLELIRMLEEELADPKDNKERPPARFGEKVDRKLVRSIELGDIWAKPESPELRSMRRLKQYRWRTMRKFTLLERSR